MKIGITILTFSVYILLGITTAKSQTTIGSLLKPAEGALLDLKEQYPDLDNVTSKNGGLLLPRVELKSLDDFFLPNPTPDQKANHKGLLVYNVRENQNLSLKKGIYQWNGVKWDMLNRITKTEGAAVKKEIYHSTSPNQEKVVSLGIFEFRMVQKNNATFPQFRLSPGLPQQSIYWQVNQYLDKSPDAFADGWAKSGYSFLLKDATATSAWADFSAGMTHLERNEIWLSDMQSKNIYNIQFLILGNAATENNTSRIYLIIAQKY
ncbi:MAG: hypothetical protein LBC48_07975 [Dysgonamonadaceae bacterium]|jgi:hypothetical protein|nr:hypothetical protein [Dysgonamonadaceae bacterium]